MARQNQFSKIMYLGLVVMVLTGLFSCEKDKIEAPELDDNQAFYQLMNEWYLWNDALPEVDPDLYESPVELLEALRYQELDRWSYVTTVADFEAYYQQGAYEGYGFGHASDADGNRRITFVFDESPLKEFGVERGWILQKVDDQLVTPETDLNKVLGNTGKFTFIKPDESVVSQTFSALEMSMNTVLLSEVIDLAGTKVGHLVFKGFLGPSEQELKQAFAKFASEGVTELVVDLRYNGGGQMNIAILLAGLIVPESLNGKVFAAYEHNTQKVSQNFSYLLEAEPNSLGLERLYVITSGGSASASEALINGLEPHMDVVLVGSQTYGKPVGMYAFYEKTDYYAYVPVTFKITNAEGFGGYYDGLPVDCEAVDDITRPFSDLQEACLYQVLYHIQNGVFDSRKRSREARYWQKPVYNSIESERGAL